MDSNHSALTISAPPSYSFFLSPYVLVSVLRSYFENMCILGGWAPQKASGSRPFLMALFLSWSFRLSLSSLSSSESMDSRGRGLMRMLREIFISSSTCSLDWDELKNKANAIWNTILELETDKYDYEQRRADQDYELKELNERRKLQLRNKAIKKGLDPEAFCGSHPPKIPMFSKYEHRTDTRNYGDRKKLYEGGAEIVRSEWLEAMWKEKLGEWNKRPKAKLPKWCGVRPGKKEGDPETPEGVEEAAEEEAAEEEYDEEEEDYDEEEEEE